MELATKKKKKVGKITLKERGFACRSRSDGTSVTDVKKILTEVTRLEENTTACGLGPDKSYGDTWDNRGQVSRAEAGQVFTEHMSSRRPGWSWAETGCRAPDHVF